MLSLRLRRPASAPPVRGAALGPARPLDTALLGVVATLLLFGLVMVFSATIALPDSPRFAGYTRTHFLLRHAVALALGTGAAVLLFVLPLKVWQRLAPWLFGLGLVLLVLVLVPGVGKMVYGARRWLSLYLLNLQPSELMKLFVVLYAADYTVRKQEWMHRFSKGFLPMATAMACVGLLLLLQPDLGAFAVMVAIAMGVLFIGGVNIRMFSGLAATLLATFLALIWLSPWRRERIFAYLDPFGEENAFGRGYQLSHSLIAFGRGELFGVGLGGSVEKLYYLPEAHTDFLLAVIGEELGLVGVLIVVALFFWLVRRAFEIGRQAVALERIFAGLVAKGIGAWIGVQAFINMGVSMGLLPTKGLTLPFVSYGGSAILVNCLAAVLLVRIDYENRCLMRGGRV
ncbi:MAG: putative lipid II flippase FtsW [Burkholderiales bacterium]|nr:MAG: putative lipid II flippase FtsW [Burkholderiales bacterium]